MNEQILAAVEDTLRRAKVWDADATLLVALSGGPDSVALLRALCALRADAGFQVRAAHVEHGLRGAASLADARFCERLCAALAVPFTCDDAGLSGDMQTPGVETRARDARYALLLDRARACHADALLLAHHLDDQAETVLAHLVRGSGARGLSGMRPVSVREGVTVLRPLLHLPKQMLIDSLRELPSSEARDGLPELEPYRMDETNGEACCQRNRLRLKVLPMLARENPRAAEHIAQSAALLALDEDCLQAQADALYADALVARAPLFCLRKAALLAAPPAVAVRALRRFVSEGWARLAGAADASPVGDATEAAPVCGNAANADAAPACGAIDASPACDATDASPARGAIDVSPVVDATDATPAGGATDAAPACDATDTSPAGGNAANADAAPPTADVRGGRAFSARAPVGLTFGEGERSLGARETMALLALLSAKPGVSLGLPQGVLASVGRTCLHLTRMDGCGAPLRPALPPAPVPLATVGGGVSFDGYPFCLCPWNRADDPPPDGVGCVVLPASRLRRCVLRVPEPGDRIRPFGAPGSKPFRRYLTDRQVDLPFRRALPVLCDGRDVLWAVGLGAAEGTRLAQEPETPCVRLCVRDALPWTVAPVTDG